MQHQKQQSNVWRDLFEPGWRERETAQIAKFLAAIPVREKVIGEFDCMPDPQKTEAFHNIGGAKP